MTVHRDRAVVAAQLGRPPRAMRAVAHRCPCGNPDVVETSPRLADGTPFPTLYYLTCPRAASAIGTPRGVRADARDDRAAGTTTPSWRRPTGARTSAYLARREAIEHGRRRSTGSAPAACRTGSSACTCWSRHALAAGPGVNPLGDEALARWSRGGRPARACGPDADRTVTRVAAIDCGTNSVRLLVADVGRRRRCTTSHREMRIVRLGQGVDRTGGSPRRRSSAPGSRWPSTPRVDRRHGAERVRMVATSATRDAANRRDFVAMVRRDARRRSRGDHRRGGGGAVVRRRGRRPARRRGPLLLVPTSAAGRPNWCSAARRACGRTAWTSARVRMTERHLRDDPPTPAQVRRRSRATSAPRSRRAARTCRSTPAHVSSASPAR